MARTLSNMTTMNGVAPDFKLLDVCSGEWVQRRSFQGQRGLLVMFICNHCPFVIHLFEGIEALAKECEALGVGVVAISSNSTQTHPQDGPEAMKKLAASRGWSFPYLFDKTQEVAKSYRAACTPDFYLLDEQHHLFYRGRLDASRPGNGIPVTGEDLRAAMDAMIQGQPLPSLQLPSMGCNIKWHPGQEPLERF